MPADVDFKTADFGPSADNRRPCRRTRSSGRASRARKRWSGARARGAAADRPIAPCRDRPESLPPCRMTIRSESRMSLGVRLVYQQRAVMAPTRRARSRSQIIAGGRRRRAAGERERAKAGRYKAPETETHTRITSSLANLSFNTNNSARRIASARATRHGPSSSAAWARRRYLPGGVFFQSPHGAARSRSGSCGRRPRAPRTGAARSPRNARYWRRSSFIRTSRSVGGAS